jgi:hypothetical protein
MHLRDRSRRTSEQEKHVQKEIAVAVCGLALCLTAGSGSAFAASPDPVWIQDGTTHAKFLWASGGSIDEKSQGYSSPASKSDAVLAFADAHASSFDDAAWANIIAVGTVGSHAAWASARANTTLYNLTPGDYRVSFLYMVGPSQTGLTQMEAEVGYETPGGHYRITGQSGDAYSAVLRLDQWIGFYAIAAGNSPIGTAETNAGIFNISVTPVPEPDAAWLFGGGLLLVALARRRLGRQAGRTGPGRLPA